MAVYFLFLIMGLANDCVSDQNAFNLCKYTNSRAPNQLCDLWCVLRRADKSEHCHSEQFIINIKNIINSASDKLNEFSCRTANNTYICSDRNLDLILNSSIAHDFSRLTDVRKLYAFYLSRCSNDSSAAPQPASVADNKNNTYNNNNNSTIFPMLLISWNIGGIQKFLKRNLEEELFKTSDGKIMETVSCKFVYCSPASLEVLNDINKDISLIPCFPLREAHKQSLRKLHPNSLEVFAEFVLNNFTDVYFQSGTSPEVAPFHNGPVQSIGGRGGELYIWKKALNKNRQKLIIPAKLSKAPPQKQRSSFFKERSLASHSRNTSEITPFPVMTLPPIPIQTPEKPKPKIDPKTKKNLPAIKKPFQSAWLNNNLKRPQKQKGFIRLAEEIRGVIRRYLPGMRDGPDRFLNDGVNELSIRANYSVHDIKRRVGKSANTRQSGTHVDENKELQKVGRHVDENTIMTNERRKRMKRDGANVSPQSVVLRQKRSFQTEFIMKKASLAYFETQPKPSKDFLEYSSSSTKVATEEDEERETNNKIKKASKGTNSLESVEKNHLRHHRNKRRKVAVSVLAAEEHSALLPCDVTSRVKNDTPILLMWFREGTHTPLFSVDFRQGSKGRPQIGHDLASPVTQRSVLHVTTEHQFYTKDFLRASNNSFEELELFTASGGNMEINPLMRSDEGVYKCRVDFLHSPTRNERVNLTVVVPSHSLELEWRRNGDWVVPSGEFLGPLIVGDSLHIVCKASAAWPPPKVIWTSEGARIDESYDQLQINSPSEQDILPEGRHLTSGENHLQLDQLERSDHLRQLNCEASNTNLTRPIVRSITLSVALPVISVTLDQPPTLDAGDTAEVQCTVRGSYPAPIIKWSLGEQELETSQFWVSKDGNVTVSVVQITPTAHQNGKPLICLAYNPILYAHKISGQHQIKKDSKLVNVEFSPQVSARLGKSLNGSRIKEGDDVYFECLVLANPPPHILEWTHEGQKMISRRGVFLTNGTLVIQKVNVSESGNYSCFAANTEGQATSGIVQLGVKFTPKCRSNSSMSYSIAKFEKARIPCNLTANPTNVDFRWSFNNTAEMVDVPKGRYSSNASVSILNYTPMNELDYGTLLCWGANEVGKQIEPCVFHIKAAGKPEPPHNCRVKQTTLSSLWVTCLPGSDGGDPQVFHLQVQLMSTEKKIVSEVTNSSPDFFAANLQPNMRYRLLITAANRRGESHPAKQLLAKTAKLGTPRQETNAEATRERKTKEDDKKKVIMGITLASTTAALVLLLVGSWACVRVRSRRRQNVGGGVTVSVETELTLTNPDETMTDEKITNEKEKGMNESCQRPQSSSQNDTNASVTHASSMKDSFSSKQRTLGVEPYEPRFYCESINYPLGSKSYVSEYESSNMFHSLSNIMESQYEQEPNTYETQSDFIYKENPTYEYSHRIFVDSDDNMDDASDHPSNSALVPLVRSFPVQISGRTSVTEEVSKEQACFELTAAQGGNASVQKDVEELMQTGVASSSASVAVKGGTKPHLKTTLRDSPPIAPFYNISGLSQTKLCKLPR